MHVMNMSLYSTGAAINLLLHVITRIVKPGEPGFFSGYGQPGAVLVILSNVLIGLVMTAVYKYADAIIKCFATAMSTAILLYISPILFGVQMSFLVLPGTTVVFIATWLYMEATPPRASALVFETMPTGLREQSEIGKWASMFGPSGQHKCIGISSATVFTIIIISVLGAWEGKNNATEFGGISVTDIPSYDFPGGVIESPFRNTMAYIRWNSKHEERISLIKDGYEPFFHTMHYSMPQILGRGNENFVNMTHDAWEDGYWGYQAVKNTMKVILKQTTEADIDGIMFFHFDVWLDPLGFADMDFDKIWFPDSEDPVYRCMKSTDRYKEWWGWAQGYHVKALQATHLVANMESKYEVDQNEWCIGWVSRKR
jgi:hypothetical protein